MRYGGSDLHQYVHGCHEADDCDDLGGITTVKFKGDDHYKISCCQDQDFCNTNSTIGIVIHTVQKKTLIFTLFQTFLPFSIFRVFQRIGNLKVIFKKWKKN